jgi:hypothetical protein
MSEIVERMSACAAALCLLIAGGLSGLASPVSADPPSSMEVASPRMPQAGQGAWRERVQLVWNGSTSQLERRRYEVFDPFAAESLDIFWEARDALADRAGRISGSGVLTWRSAGALRYGPSSIMAQYRGGMADGHASGHGIFVDRSGLRYDGEWVDGLMDGTGHLMLPNGDVYRGGFKQGRIHGQGLYIDAVGRVYDGGFSAGLRDGPAQVTEPDGRVYAGVWRHGVEDEARRGPVDESFARLYRVQARAGGPADLAITVSVGGPPQFCCHHGPPSFGYAATSFADRIEIFPDAPLMLDIWRGRANIVIPDVTSFDWARAGIEEYSFLNYNSTYIKAVPLQFGLENRGTKPVTVVGGYLDIVRSQVDPQPALQSLELKPLTAQNLVFSIENYGWSPARNARLTVRFQNGKGQQTDPVTIPIGEIASVHQFSFAAALAQLGVRTKELPKLANACNDREERERAGCLAKIVRSGVFGKLAEYVATNDKKFGFQAVGQVEYEWRDADGRTQNTAAPFDALVPIGSFVSLAECEGCDYQDVAKGQPFQLGENRERYRIPFPLQTSVGAGAISRWRITLDATKSSNHQMRIVLQLADGEEVVSRNISILLFHPNSYPASVRPFEPRC